MFEYNYKTSVQFADYDDQTLIVFADSLGHTIQNETENINPRLAELHRNLFRAACDAIETHGRVELSDHVFCPDNY